jgi:hypothetical protein
MTLFPENLPIAAACLYELSKDDLVQLAWHLAERSMGTDPEGHHVACEINDVIRALREAGRIRPVEP